MLLLADDLTGANDAAVQFSKRGFSVVVQVLEGSEDRKMPDCDLLAVNTDSRPLLPQEAQQRVKQTLLALGTEQPIYKKIDSLLRGNPDSELEGVLEALGDALAIVAPAYPENQRTMEKGILRWPGGSTDGLALFRQGMTGRVEPLPLQQVRQGPDKLVEWLRQARQAGVQTLVADAVTREDLASVAQAAEKLPRVVLCGSAGLAGAVADQLAARMGLTPKFAPEEETDGAVLTVVGSRNRETAQQVEELRQRFGLQPVLLDTDALWENPKRELERCLGELRRQLGQGSRELLLAVDSLYKPFQMVLRDTPEQYEKARQIVEQLGEMARQLCVDERVTGVVATGGDTALQVCRAMGTGRLTLEGEVAPGIPAGRMLGGARDGLRMVTKSGGFGQEDALVRAVEYLRGRGEHNGN
ncbi:MAG: four-carbon acid sugar kinase family protein [Eubacteriales bacterium]